MVEAQAFQGSNLQTVERSVRLLQHVVFQQQPVGTRESARILGISPSSAHRLLKTLTALGLLRQDEATSEFIPGLELYRLSATLLASNDVSQAARRPMQRLAKQTGETVHLLLRYNGSRLVLDTVPGWRQLQYTLRLGEEVPLHVGSSGFAILAWLPDEEIKAIVEKGLVRYSPTTITEPSELYCELRETRSRGFAISFGHYTGDGAGISAPIFGVHNATVGSLLITIPVTRLDEHGSLHDLGLSVREAADEVSLYLGGQPEDRRAERG